ncbi:efflux RND transporter periplasmic adaptor subunit [Stenotrophomonas maltophilia]|uniref:efflux RND transporter periplasmic adaptor subunit n=1 Tax=Stenotrophomonas maltophilia TaxID=40324 RepID=UPI001E55696B|nr:efflux RND transporter periplasmic adaptor subunit [Stenotrophomonas maltophilia]MCD5963435.1 efflux RND transporter periplasmic adaptor subunit [Stenotrophomonas maltophilia]
MNARFAFLGLVLGSVIGLSACSSGSDGAGGWPATKVALAPVERARAPRTFHGVGELEAARQVDLASEAAGRVVRIAFTSGQRVKQGELLVQINDAPEQAERLRLRAQLRNAETVLARTRRLMADKVATQEQLDHAQAARDMAQGELRGIEALIAQKAIRAPFAGTIGIRRVHEGQYLAAGDGIASLIDAGTLKVNFALDERAVPHVRPGQPVEIRVDAWPGRRFEAQVSAVDPLIGASRTLRVQASLPNVDGVLQAGMFANVRVLREQPTPVLAVPETAVTYTAYGQTVFVAEAAEPQGMTVRRVAVKTGERWDGRVEIVSGLKEGDRVVVSGQLKLSDGMPVEPVARDALEGDAASRQAKTAREQAT